jgi:signal transduction histidine kinase
MRDESTPFDEEKLRYVIQLYDAAQQAFLCVDEYGSIIAYNQTAQSLFHYTGADISALSINEIIISPPVMEVLRENIDQLQVSGCWLGDFKVNQGDGSKVSMPVLAAVLQREEPMLFGLIVSLPDTIKVQQIQEVNQILIKIDELLRDSVDYADKFNELAQLLIPVVADWCIIHTLKPDGSIERAAVAPGNILCLQGIYNWLENDLINDEADGLPEVLKSGKTQVVTDVSPVRRAADAGIKSFMIVPLVTHKQMLGAITFVGAETGRHFNQNSSTIAENIAIHIATYFEKSQLHRESKKQFAELEQRVGEGTAELQEAMSQLKQSEGILQTLFRLSNKLNATLDVDLILDMLAQEAIQIVNGESGFAGLRSVGGMSVKKYFQQGVEIPFVHTWVEGEDIPGWVLKYKVPYGTSDAENDPLIRFDLPINAGVRSVICTPILDTVGEVIAYFDIRNKQGSEGFSINDQEMLLTLAPVASIAIQNALAYQQRLATVSELNESTRQYQELAASLESAREEERTEVARELHDQLGQALTAIKFDLVWLTNQLEQKDDVLAQKIKDITAQLNTLINNVRRIATELRPGMLEDLGLAASIEWQAHDFEKRSGIKCKLDLPEAEISLTHDQALAIFRILQEALTNVVRYAEAKHVEITLIKSGDLVTLELNDDGRGIKQEEITNFHSLGLLGMHERAKHLGGTFEIHGLPDQGTSLKVTIPVNRIDAQTDPERN